MKYNIYDEKVHLIRCVLYAFDLNTEKYSIGD